MTIGHLKESIKEKLRPRFNSIPVNELTLWKVDISVSDENLETEIPAETNINQELGGIMLSPFKTIGEYFYESNSNIRIIVQPPTTTGRHDDTAPRKINITDAFPQGLPYVKPKPLVSSYGSNWQYQRDPELVATLRKETKDHYFHFREGRNDKIHRPIYLFFSGAGTGKSRNASEFHDTLIECLKDSNDLVLKEKIQKAWVFHVSLENGTSFSRRDEPIDILAIGIRMLKQICRTSVDFNRFRLAYEAPTPWEVIKLIAKYENKAMDQVSVILVVDGLQNFITAYDDGLNEDSAFYQTLTQIGDLATDNATFLIPCCTATITRPFKSTMKPTGRLRINLPIISLQPPTILEVDTVVQVFQQDNHIVKLLVDDCGGHGRALEVLAEIMSDKSINEFNVENLMHNIRVNLISRYKDALDITASEAQAIARAILTRKRVNYNKFVPNTEKLPDSFIQPGLIRFERIGDSAEGYFNAPYIWIWIISQQATKDGDPLLRDWQFCDYKEHNSVHDRRLPPGAQFWNHFENFVATFRSLKSRVLKDGELTTISEIHSGARLRLNKDFNFINHHLILERAIHQENTNSATYDGGSKIIQCEGSSVNIREGRHCIMNATSSPYGDSFLGLDQSKNNNPNEVHQAKRWKTKSPISCYQDERNKSACDEDFFILFTTARDCDFELPMNSGIVDASNWKNYFGPFSGRAHIYAVVGPLNVNTATYTELMTVEGIGEQRTRTILEKRPFKDIEDAEIKTNIPEKVLKKFKFLGITD